MLEVSDVVVTYPGPPRYLASDHVSFAIEPGRTLGLVGESGSGKSTIARAVIGLVPVESGEVLLDGSDVTNLKGRRLRDFRRQVQLVFQDPASSLNPRMTVGLAVAEAAAVAHGVRMRSEVARREARSLFERVELPGDVADRYPFQLSGGQLQRVAIARALATQPTVLLLDEVTASLDVSVQAVILNLLRRLQDELGLTMLYISHDLSVIRYVSDHVSVMRTGRIVEQAETTSLFEQPRDAYTQSLLAAVPTFGGARWRSTRGVTANKEPRND